MNTNKMALPALATAIAALTACSSPAPTVQPGADTPAVSSPVAPAPVTPTSAVAKPADTGPAMTAGQKNALGKAESYLSVSAFSRTGLIKQLEFEKFSKADATWAVDHVKANWKEQAAKKAAQYLETQSFSHQGLVDQLVFEGFTAAEAEYGVTKAGL
jgi:hypothetical protein